LCGACTILFDDEPMRSCLMFAVQANNHEIVTVEGLGTPDNLHPIQQAFIEEHALQCGYCTPGFLMSLVAYLKTHPMPDDEEIREAIDGNICRCTGYEKIIEATLDASKKMSSGK